MSSSNSTKPIPDQYRESYSDNAKARRVTLVGSTGLVIGDDLATETTLSSIDGKDFATETTLSSLSSKLPSSLTTNNNLKISIEELESGVSVNSNSQLKTTLFDSSGNEFSSQTDANGGHYLGTTIKQAVYSDPNNSSTTNLSAGNSYTFTGTSTTTLGVAGLQINLKTDQNATIYVDQSVDGTNWDITDTFSYYYSKGGFSETIQATNSYWRVRVVLIGTTATTYFRLNSILCPVVEALPRALNNYGRLKTSTGIIDEETGTRVEVDQLNSLKMVTPVRLVGTQFSGTTKDTNFWTESGVVGTGSVTQSGEILISTGTTANSSITYTSVRTARKVTGASNQFRAVARLGTDPQANNVRRLGCYTDTDGLFFQVSGTTFGVGARKGGVDTIVNSGSFNGNYGSSVVMDTSIQRLVINYDHLSAKFFVNGILLHTITASSTAYANTLNFPIKMENTNSGGNTTDNIFYVRFACIVRLGNLITSPLSKYITANNTYILKYGAGNLQKIVNVNNAGTITIYDNISATGTPLVVIDGGKILGSIAFDIPFYTGLTVVNSGASFVVVYE